MSSTISSTVSSLNTDLASSASSSSSGSSSSGSSTSTSTSGTSSSTAGSLSNYATSSTTGTLSSLGIGSGIDASSLISQLISADQAPITAINTQISSYQSELTSYGTLSAAVYSFQTALNSLSSASAFQATTATPTDTSVLSATTDSTAVPGTYSVTVNQLATAQSLVATGQTSASASIGSGTATTLNFQFGTVSGGTLSDGAYTGSTFTQSAARGGGTVTIDSSNNSLQGIAAAINSAGIGVTASVINDGSSTPYRLSLSSSSTGADGSMKITVSGDSALSSLLSEDPAGTQDMVQTQAAQSASLSVNGLAITSASNTVKGTLTGTTLNLTGTGTTGLTVAQDTQTISTNVQAFVTAYNTLDSSINQLTAAADSTTGSSAGVLAGQYNVVQMQSELRNALTDSMVGSSGSQSTLADVGITFQKDGTLALDSSKLSSVMSSNPNEVADLFAQNGVATDSLIQFTKAGSAAAPGSYAVNIAKLATQGAVTGSSTAGLTITAGVNDSLTAVVDGTAAAVTIPPGTYTADTLATAVQSAINGSSTLAKAGLSVSVGQNNGTLTVTSASYGSNSYVSLGGDAASNLVGSSPTSTDGTDVQGSIGGLPATGSGQTLTGLSGSAVDGVTLTVQGGSTGSRGTVNISQGYANILNNLATQFNSSNGLITSATDAINSDITDDNNQVTRLNQQLSLLQEQYQTEFSNLDTILSGLNSTQSYLTSQLSSLANTTNYIYSSSSSSG